MMGNMLNEFGQYREAIPYLEKTLALSPGKQSAIAELSKSYWGLGDKTKAFEIFNKAYVWLGDYARDLYTKPYESASEFQKGRSDAQSFRLTLGDSSNRYSNK
jgi:tetratricopeptide (TPR) repeat protein